MEVWLFHALFGVLLILPWQSLKGIRLLDEQVVRDRNARVLFYRNAIAGQWLLAFLALILLWSSDPDIVTGFLNAQLSADAVAITGIASIALASQCPLVPWVMQRLRKSPSALRGLYPLRNILPRSAQERQLWVSVAITAGICEEILFRGFLINYAQSVLAMETAGAVALSSAIFALGHYYQGTANMVRVGLVGVVLGIVFVVTDSIIYCAVLHAILDLGALPLAEIIPGDDIKQS